MAFSPWTLFGQSVGSGLSQGYQDQTRFNNILNRADTISQLPQDRQNIALALMGGGKSSGNPLDAIIAALVAQQFGLNQPGGVPSQNIPSQNPVGPKTIRVRDKASGETGSIPEAEFDPKIYDRI